MRRCWGYEVGNIGGTDMDRGWTWVGVGGFLVGVLLGATFSGTGRAESRLVAVEPEPAVRVVRKCKAPEKGWCVLDVMRLGEPVPEACVCGPLPKEYKALTEPDESWKVLRDYRRAQRKESKKR
jgi:hypothetical protein